MPDWTALRRRARAYHQQVRSQLPAQTPPLVPAEALLAAAEAETGLTRLPLPPGDSLLAGAQAVLDRDMGCIWYAQDDGLPEARQRFAQAHEFAHHWLHPGPCRCHVEDGEDAFLAEPLSPGAQVAYGYSPAERRETEANLFAAEFLLPAPALRHAFLVHGWNAARIAEHVGLSESCVLAQLAEALLLPQQVERETGSQKRAKGSGGASPRRGLNASQRAAAEVEAGPVLVDAGPGTGKTHTLVARALYLLQERGVAPENILALTFSNKAAEEMRTRLAAVVPDAADRLWIGTFHAFGLEMLRKEGSRIGLPLRPGLLELADAIVLLERHLDRLPLSEFAYLHDPTLPFASILNCISRAKDELKTPADYMAAALAQHDAAKDGETRRAALKSLEIAHIYRIYQDLLAEYGLLDFGDLLMRPVELLDRCPNVQERWQAQYPHILADEYQDINRASAQLVRRLAGDGRGLWAVGDLRQAIYRFRGASPANVRQFEQDFPGGRRLQLDVNYRSRPSLVSLFSAVAAQMPAEPSNAGRTRAHRAWQAHRDETGSPAITLAVAADEEAHADGLAAQIRAWEAAGVPLRDQAILCRTNAQATDLSERLEARGVPTLHLGDLFDRPEVKDLLSLLALACGPTGRELARVAQFADYSIPAEDVSCLLRAVQEAGVAFPGALALAADLPSLSEAGRRGLLRLWAHLQPLVYRGDAWLLLARYLFDISDYLRPLLAGETIASRQKLLALYQLLSFAQDYGRKLAQTGAESPQRAFLEHIRRLRACKEDKVRLPAAAEELDGVRLMTIHASKGLEFPVVYLPHLTKGQFPPRAQSSLAEPPPSLLLEAEPESAADRETAEEAEGESCLFFVALSRARDHLALCRAESVRGKSIAPSPLLAGIEAALERSGARLVRWERAAPETEETEEAAESNVEGESLPGDRPELPISALEQYQRCPRQFYYQRIACLPAQEADPIYLAFYHCMQAVARWTQEQQAAGRTPTLAERKARWEALWAERVPDPESGQAKLLHAHAQSLLENVPDYSPPSDAAEPTGLELVADLPNGRVRLSCDHAEQLPDGTLRLGRYVRGRAKKDDHTAPRLALMRHAARQQDPARPVEIALYYLADGQQREVPEKPRYEPARVAKYDEALRGIRAGHFPPESDDRKCAQCPYFFLCPA